MSARLQFLPWLACVLCIAALLLWLGGGRERADVALRLPGQDGRVLEAGTLQSRTNPVFLGRLVSGPGKQAALVGTWSRFRGDELTGRSTERISVAAPWGETGPRKLWSIEVGEGYAGAAIWRGRVFLMDYDRDRKEEALRCLSLADGQEIWRYAFPNNLKRDHGVTRSVPFVDANSVVAIGPKCHVLCLETATGKLRWSVDMVKDFGTTVPPWYTGQCPLVENGQVILAPGGAEALLMAVNLENGNVVWRTPNPRDWKMTHSSVMPVQFAGRRMYVYCGSGGVAGVSADDGTLLWETTEWKISIATVPAPLDLGNGRVFLTGGYNAGSLLLQLKDEADRIVPETVYRLKPTVFGATQHTPIHHRNRLFGVRADGRFVCLNPADGTIVWTSEPGSNFGLGSFIIADDRILALNDNGTLHVIAANPESYQPLMKAKVLEGPESWGPMALADGRLIVRDLHRMACLEMAVSAPALSSN